MSDAQDIYVTFDGPPGPESGRFVEVEDAKGRGLEPIVTGAFWQEEDGSRWVLGPFANKDDYDGLVAALQDIARQAEDETFGIQADRLIAIANQAHKVLASIEKTEAPA